MVANEGQILQLRARKESENPDIEVSVGRGERDAVYEEPVFALEAEKSVSRFYGRENGMW